MDDLQLLLRGVLPNKQQAQCSLIPSNTVFTLKSVFFSNQSNNNNNNFTIYAHRLCAGGHTQNNNNNNNNNNSNISIFLVLDIAFG